MPKCWVLFGILPILPRISCAPVGTKFPLNEDVSSFCVISPFLWKKLLTCRALFRYFFPLVSGNFINDSVPDLRVTSNPWLYFQIQMKRDEQKEHNQSLKIKKYRLNNLRASVG